MEVDYGITEYRSKELPKFGCIVKHRYQDFHVREIDKQGNIVRLTSLNPSSDVSSTEPSRTNDNNVKNGQENAGKSTDEQQKRSRLKIDENAPLPDLLPAQIAEQLDKLFLSVVEEAKLEEQLNIPCDSFNKAERTLIHQKIRERFGGLLLSRTKTLDGKQVIVVSPSNDDNPDKWDRKRKYTPGRERVGKFCHFTLYKEFKDTQFAISLVAKLCGKKVADFSVAGSKDRRAITTQRVSVYRVQMAALSGMNTRLRNIRLGNFDYRDYKLALGDLTGNRFSIVLRKVEGIDENELKQSVDMWKESGFINYYGTQRFGTHEIGTHEIGRCILKEDWQQAVDLILSPRLRSEGLSEAQNEWKSSRNAEKAFYKIPGGLRFATIEGQILAILKRATNTEDYDYKRAILGLARNTRSLYVHSYQSLIWNRIATLRVQKFVIEPILGDLFIVAKENLAEGEDGAKVEILTSNHNLASIDPFQIVLPLPNESMKRPQNEVGAWYDEILKEDGLSVEDFGKLGKEFTVAGSITRPLFVQPKSVEYRTTRYNDAMISLIRSDLDLIMGNERVVEKVENTARDTAGAMDAKVAENDDCDQRKNCAVETSCSSKEGRFLAAILEFSLPAGSYATVALRELTRSDMGKKGQMSEYDVDKTEDTEENLPIGEKVDDFVAEENSSLAEDISDIKSCRDSKETDQMAESDELVSKMSRNSNGNN